MPYRTLEDLTGQLADLAPGAKLYVPMQLLVRLFGATDDDAPLPDALEAFAKQHGCTIAPRSPLHSLPCFVKAEGVTLE
jgi:hypothetical protein